MAEYASNFQKLYAVTWGATLSATGVLLDLNVGPRQYTKGLNVRANARVTVKLEKLNQAAVVIAGITLYEFPATAALVNVDTPIGQPGNLLASAGCGFNQCGIYLRGSDPGVQQTGSSTATLESLRLRLTETLINDQVNFRLRYLEFDLERPPGG